MVGRVSFGCREAVGLIAIFVLLMLCIPVPMAFALDNSAWVEYGGNPVFHPWPDHRAYYPSVIYDASQFSGHGASYYYKMWYSTGSALRLAYSNDGMNWVEPGGEVGSLMSPNHPCVLYDAGGFGEGVYYKIWYWNSQSEYTTATGPIRYAESSDGTVWFNDQRIGEDPSFLLVTGWVAPYWFYSSYGPSQVLYNLAGYGTLNDADPMGNKYVMYYDAASQGSAPDGTVEGTALAYSADGKYWRRYGSEPVLKASGGSEWDSGYAYAWTVLKSEGAYRMWYSGSQGSSNEGMGYAESSDGLTWSRKPPSPIFHKTDAGYPGDPGWRSDRTYTPKIIYDANQFGGHGDAAYYKMWYTGKRPAQAEDFAIGYATLPGGGGPPEQEKAVGGVFAPTNKFGLLAPWIGLSSLLAVAAISVLYLKRRRKHA